MNENMAKCMLVAKVLVADGIMTENERAFLDRAMRGLSLTEAERKQVVDLQGWDDAEPIVAKLSMDDRRAVLRQLVDAAGADGRMSPMEMAMVKKITAALGVEA